MTNNDGIDNACLRVRRNCRLDGSRSQDVFLVKVLENPTTPLIQRAREWLEMQTSVSRSAGGFVMVVVSTLWFWLTSSTVDEWTPTQIRGFSVATNSLGRRRHKGPDRSFVGTSRLDSTHGTWRVQRGRQMQSVKQYLYERFTYFIQWIRKPRWYARLSLWKIKKDGTEEKNT